MIDLQQKIVYLISCNQTPSQHEYLLQERHLRDRARIHRILTVDDILIILHESMVKWVQVNFSMDNLKQTVMLIDDQILVDLLLQLFLIRIVSHLAEVLKHFVKCWVSALDQVF
jgi:hypothetical protein